MFTTALLITLGVIIAICVAPLVISILMTLGVLAISFGVAVVASIVDWWDGR